MRLFKLKNSTFEQIITIISLISFSANLLFPKIALAEQITEITGITAAQDEMGLFYIKNTQSLPLSIAPEKSIQNGKKSDIIPLPKAKNNQTKKTIYITVTAYSSTEDQTDSTPCITANGFDVCEHNEENIIAANSLPFGAKVRFPDYTGDKVFYVQDRMHSRYSNRIDIWMQTREKAQEFGVKRLKMEIL